MESCARICVQPIPKPRVLTPRHCSRLRSPVSRCSPDRNTLDSGRRTRLQSVQFPDRQEEWKDTPSLQAGPSQTTIAGCAGPSPADRRERKPGQHNQARADRVILLELSCTDVGAATLHRSQGVQRCSSYRYNPFEEYHDRSREDVWKEQHTYLHLSSIYQTSAFPAICNSLA